jgi:hypothetical protein
MRLPLRERRVSAHNLLTDKYLTLSLAIMGNNFHVTY